MTNFATLPQMMDECDRRNAQAWVKAVDRWYFVVPPFHGEPAYIDYREGHTGQQMRAQANGTALPEWKPEPGEVEWIKAATADYVSRLRVPNGEEPGITRAKFSQHMARLSAGEPWRQQGEAA